MAFHDWSGRQPKWACLAKRKRLSRYSGAAFAPTAKPLASVIIDARSLRRGESTFVEAILHVDPLNEKPADALRDLGRP